MKTLQINEELHRELKALAASLGMPVIRATQEAVEDWIQKVRQQKEQEEQEHGGYS